MAKVTVTFDDKPEIGGPGTGEPGSYRMTARVEFTPELVQGEPMTTAQEFGFTIAKELSKYAAPEFAGAMDMFAASDGEPDEGEEMPFAVELARASDDGMPEPEHGGES
jgi:hypothetical protein